MSGLRVGYLNNRKQLVKIGESGIRLDEGTCGVPQGSVLGPLVFIFYTNKTNIISRLFVED